MATFLPRTSSMVISDEALGSIGEALDSRHFRAALHERLAVIEAVSVDSREKIGVHVSGFTLAVCAGMVNAVAFAGFKNYVSHVSGSSTAIGLRSNGLQDPDDVATPALLVLDFIIGSTLCGLIVPKATLKIGKAPCSSWSGNVIRTTHMTGTGTDLGLAMGRIISRFLSKRGNFAPEDWEYDSAGRNKVILMSLLLAGFIGGAFLGTVVWKALGEQDGDGLYTLLLPAGLYCSLSVAHEFYAKSENEAITESVALEAITES